MVGEWPRHKLDVIEIKCFRSVCEVTRTDRWRNEEKRCRFGAREKDSERVDWKVLKWFRHLDCVSGEHLTRV